MSDQCICARVEVSILSVSAIFQLYFGIFWRCDIYVFHFITRSCVWYFRDLSFFLHLEHTLFRFFSYFSLLIWNHIIKAIFTGPTQTTVIIVNDNDYRYVVFLYINKRGKLTWELSGIRRFKVVQLIMETFLLWCLHDAIVNK